MKTRKTIPHRDVLVVAYLRNRRGLAAGMLCWLLLAGASAARGADSDIRFNSLGFLPDMPKEASVAAPCSTFQVKRASDGQVVFEGTATGPVHNSDTGEDIWIADFSAVSDPGEYFLEVPGVGRSPNFPIGEDVYDSAFYTVMRGFYLWRCGTAVEGEHEGDVFQHDACHLQDGDMFYITGEHQIRDGVGGWHDAGDYGKYVTNAGITMGLLFKAWEHFQSHLRPFSLDIPETAPGLPLYLQELKWEVDWLLKMEYPDGSGRVAHKLTRRNFSAFIMPEDDRETRYFVPWGSTATADFAAMMAAASRVFRPYAPAYAQQCLQAAQRAYNFLLQNPAYVPADQSGFSTGGYESSDDDDRLWAAAEIWEATGDAQALADFEARARAYPTKIDTDFDWGNVKNLGMITYLESSRPGRDTDLVEQIRRFLVQAADLLVSRAKAHGYRRPFSKYYWGANGTVARQTLLLQAANRVAPNPEYVHTALDAIAHLFGRNVHRRSYVTGLGIDPPLHPHDRRSGADGVANPWPGYLVGGGWPGPRDWKDEEASYQTNEIAINWQAALVYALAGFLSEPEEPETIPQLALGGGYECVLLVSNPREDPWTGSIEAYRNDHEPWLVMFEVEGEEPLVAATTEISLPGRTTRKVVIRPAAEEAGTARGGYLLLQPSGHVASRLLTTFFYHLRLGGELLDSVGVTPSPAAVRFRLPVEKTATADTGVAWTTAGPASDFDIVFRLWESGGAVGAEELVPYQGHQAKFISELFEGYLPPGGGEFLGWLDIESPVPIHATALRLEYGGPGGFQLTSTPLSAN
ncbi:MAG: hypothetical protein Kow00109_13240 [Acidobacteriota bacterium]